MANMCLSRGMKTTRNIIRANPEYRKRDRKDMLCEGCPYVLPGLHRVICRMSLGWKCKLWRGESFPCLGDQQSRGSEAGIQERKETSFHRSISAGTLSNDHEESTCSEPRLLRVCVRQARPHSLFLGGTMPPLIARPISPPLPIAKPLSAHLHGKVHSQRA